MVQMWAPARRCEDRPRSEGAVSARQGSHGGNAALSRFLVRQGTRCDGGQKLAAELKGFEREEELAGARGRLRGQDRGFRDDFPVFPLGWRVPSFCWCLTTHASRACSSVGWDLGDEEPRAHLVVFRGGEHAGLWTALHTSNPESLGAFKGKRVGSSAGRLPTAMLLCRVCRRCTRFRLHYARL